MLVNNSQPHLVRLPLPLPLAVGGCYLIQPYTPGQEQRKQVRQEQPGPEVLRQG